MRVLSPNVVAILLIAIGLAVPTGAVVGDRVGGTGGGGVVLAPHDGPNGQYASLDGDGNLTVDLGDELNPDAVTTFDGVFDVSNTGSDDRRVWIDHGATRYVEFRTARSGPIEGSGTVLSPGETVTVDVTVDTHGAAPGTRLIDEIEVHATGAGPTTAPTSNGPGGTGSGSGGSGSRSAPTGTAVDPSDGTVVGSGTVRIEFDREVRADESASVDPRDGLPPDPADGGIWPEVSHENAAVVAANESHPASARLRGLGVDSVATEGVPVSVTAARTRFGSAASIDPDRRTAAVYEITVPPRLRGDWATVWVRVNRSRFDGGDPTEAGLVRFTGEGWQLLETRTVRANDTHAVLRSRTPGFSPFAVFVAPGVTYRWTFEGRRDPTVGEAGSVTYDEPGVYAVSLSVTDARGNTNGTTHRVLVNDRPDVQVDVPSTVEPGEPVTLEADVTDRYGNATVRWRFDDGRTRQGRTVTRSFDRGGHTVTVHVVDGLGATTTVEARVVAGRPGPVTRAVEYALGVERRLALIALAALVVVGGVRWLVDRYGGGRRRRRR